MSFGEPKSAPLVARLHVTRVAHPRAVDSFNFLSLSDPVDRVQPTGANRDAAYGSDRSGGVSGSVEIP